MKKLIALLLSVFVVMGCAACGTAVTMTVEEQPVSVGSVEALEELVNKDIDDTVAGLRADYDALAAEIDTYDKYTKNKSKVEDFYTKILAETRDLCLRMREYGICYAELVMKMGGTYEEKYDAFSEMYDCIYDDACGEIYDAIYEDLQGDMYDLIYDGVVSDGYDLEAYALWSKVSSEAYDMWRDSLSDVYDEWSDALSDIYDFWSDVLNAILDDDTEEIREEIEKFEEENEKLRDAGVGEV